jgi:hypothetical protein
MSELVRLDVKVELQLKERFSALARARNSTMSALVVAMMVRACEKNEQTQRDERRREEEHQAKVAALLRRKSNRQAP